MTTEQLVRELRSIARSCFKPTAPGRKTIEQAANALQDLPALRTEWEQELLSDEAVEASAKARYEREKADPHWSWDTTTKGRRQWLRTEARAALQAAISSTKKGADR